VAIFAVRSRLKKIKHHREMAAVLREFEELIPELAILEPTNEETALAAEMESCAQQVNMVLDTGTFRRTVDAIVAEERGKQHNVLADQIERVVRTTNGNALSNAPRHVPEGSQRAKDIISEIMPRRKLDDLVLPDTTQLATRQLIEEQQRTGIKLHWGTANLFSNPRFVHGAATSCNADVFAYAAARNIAEHPADWHMLQPQWLADLSDERRARLADT